MRTNHGWVYIVRSYNLYKIGSAGNLPRRLMQLRTAAPFLEEIYSIPCVAYRDIERHLHGLFGHKREAGEWFALSGADLLSIVEMEWADFPAEKKAREYNARLYREVSQALADNPELFTILKQASPNEIEGLTAGLIAQVAR